MMTFPLFENVRKTPPAKRLTKHQKIRVPSNLSNSIVLSKMLTVFYSIHNPLFSALRGFHTLRNESPSRGTRFPNLVLRGFHNLRLISFAALRQLQPNVRNVEIGLALRLSLHRARVMPFVRIVDPLSRRRAGSWCGTPENNHELSLGHSGDSFPGREVVGWRVGGSLMCSLLNREEMCRTIYVCNSF